MHFAVAHLFLYGLLKDWALVWTDSTKPRGRADLATDTSEEGPVFSLPAYIKRQMLARIGSIYATRMWSSHGANFLRCLAAAPIGLSIHCIAGPAPGEVAPVSPDPNPARWDAAAEPPGQ